MNIYNQPKLYGMKSLLPFSLSLLILTFLINVTNAQYTAIGHQHENSSGPLNFIENKTQWDESVLYKTNFEGSNTIFIQRQGFTFLMTSPDDLNELHLKHKASMEERKKLIIHQHAYKVDFLGSSPSSGRGIAKRSVYHNYFNGKDQSKWVGHVGLYGKVVQQNIYPGVHLETYSQNGHLKYDFIIEPGADPSKIKLAYTGVDKMALVEGNLNIHTSVGKITEMSPVAYQEIDGHRINVPCYFYLENNVLSCAFPESYNKEYELVIDPTIIASTMTGTTGDSGSLGNWGHSATNDNAGNIYGAGISFVTTFPTTLGAFQGSFGGGERDIAIIKYNQDGSNMIYATYIGGDQDEWPHSIITDFNQQVYIYGSTQSSNYPITTNGFQQNFGGDRDIVISILSQDGSSLIGSSFFGGSDADGFNENFSLITNSYGDEFRGEIVIDGQNNIYVTSSSQSTDFPVTANAYDNSIEYQWFSCTRCSCSKSQ